MQINIGQLLWSLTNIFLVISIVFVLYNTYKNVKNKAENQRMQNEVIVKKLEEVAMQNQKIMEMLSDKSKN